MTEAELIGAASDLAAGVQESVSLYLTVVSAYLIVAYVAGKDLSLFQVMIINVLFVVFGISFVFAIQEGLANHYLFASEIAEIRPDYKVVFTPSIIRILFAIDTGGVLAALLFMWNVRHPKIE